MSVLELYNAVREKYPEITAKADIEHIRIWDEIDPKYAYSWFESLAKALNKEMTLCVDADNYKDLFNFVSVQYRMGVKEIRDCIDVAFVENLFWRISSVKAESYWKLLPDNLKELYVNFFGRIP